MRGQSFPNAHRNAAQATPNHLHITPTATKLTLARTARTQSPVPAPRASPAPTLHSQLAPVYFAGRQAESEASGKHPACVCVRVTDGGRAVTTASVFSLRCSPPRVPHSARPLRPHQATSSSSSSPPLSPPQITYIRRSSTHRSCASSAHHPHPSPRSLRSLSFYSRPSSLNLLPPLPPCFSPSHSILACTPDNTTTHFAPFLVSFRLYCFRVWFLVSPTSCVAVEEAPLTDG